jgi:hypothetical protein
VLAALREDSGIDVWLVFGRPIVDRYYPALIAFAQASGKAVVVSCGVPLEREVHESLRAGGIAVLEDPELCLRALGCIQRAAVSERIAPGRAQGIQARPDLRGRGNDDRIHAIIENDREFGPVLVLRLLGAQSRVVRALPASADDLSDAVREIAAAEGRRCDSTERIVASLQKLGASTPPGADAHIDVTLAL